MNKKTIRLRCQHQYKKIGFAIVEIVACFIIFVLVLFLFLDFVTLFQGAAINDALAKNEARAAAMGPPGKLEEGRDRRVTEGQLPYKRALIVLRSGRLNLWDAFEISEPIKVTETIDPPVPSELFGGVIKGTVTVENTIHIHPKFVIGLFVPNHSVTLNSSKTFPYAWVMESKSFKKPGSAGNSNTWTGNGLRY